MTVAAFLGTGTMGAPMAANLVRAGFDLRLYNRTRSKAEAVAADVDSLVADTPAEAARGADVVITMLAGVGPLLDVYRGADGVLAGLGEDAVCVDMGTTGPAGVAALVELVGARAPVVDAPVSGSTDAAESAQLTLMVGGPEDAVARVRPLLEAMGSTIYHLGRTGTGSVVKLAVNSIIFALGNAVAEALVLAERAGVDREAVYEVFENSAVAAPMIAYRREAYVHPEATAPMFALTLARKDLALIADLAQDVGVPMPQARTNLQMVDEAVAAGYGDHDMADVAVHLRDRAGN